MPMVLIIDDYELNVRLLEDLLGFSGYQTATATTAEEGIEIARRVHPDLILMDMRLGGSGIDGWTATRVIKNDAELAHIPVIALAAQVWEGERERALEAGCDDYIPKPFGVRELQQKISRHLNADAKP